jgi:hypothetical protein
MELREKLQKAASDISVNGLSDDSKKQKSIFEKVANKRIEVITSFINDIK